jgi:Domain of unknown function (DUF4118)
MSARGAGGDPMRGGIAWGTAGFAASLLLGAVLEPFRDRLASEHVVIAFLAVVIVTAAAGGRTAGILSALSAALSYNFFFTTPHRTLRIDSAEQVVTVVLLFAAGLLASVGGRLARKAGRDERLAAGALDLLNRVAEAVATEPGPAADRVAATGVRELLGAGRVEVRRDGQVTAAAGEAGGKRLEEAGLPRMEADGRLPDVHRFRAAGLVLPAGGVAVPMVRGGEVVGALLIVPGDDRGVPRSVREALATVGHVLAAAPAPQARPAGPA